jgi:hypothetical protein
MEQVTRSLNHPLPYLPVFAEYAMPRVWTQSFIAQSSDLFGGLFVSVQLRLFV